MTYTPSLTQPTLIKQQTIQRTVLTNGLTVITGENPVADIVAARIFVRVGTCYETRSQAGLFSLLASLLTKGTQRLSAFDIADQIESVGASLGTDAAADYSILSLKTVTADFESILALAAHILREPSFPANEIELERRLTLQSLRSMQEQPFTVAYNALRQAMYGDHPYALSSLGTEDTVKAVTREDLQRAHETYFRPDNMVVSIVGRITHDYALALVDQVLGDWQVPAQALPPLRFPALPTDPIRVITPQETNQSIVMVGYPADRVKSPAYPALKLLNTYLGNGLSSRLFVELREKRGLAYDVSAFYPTRLDASQFVAYIGTSPENSEIALDGLCYEVERLCTTDLTPEELQASKNKLLGQYALGKQTNAQIAQLLGWYEILGLGLSYDQEFQTAIAAVTADEARLVAEATFQQPYISVLGPSSAVEALRTPKS